MKLTTFLHGAVLLLIGLVCFPVDMMAQGNPGSDPDVPVDGGVGLLIAAGIAYGAKKASDARKAKGKSQEK